MATSEDDKEDNVKSYDSADDLGAIMAPSQSIDNDAVIMGFGLTGGIVPSAVSDQGGLTSKKMASAEEVSKNEKSPSLSDDDNAELGTKGEEKKNRILLILLK